MPEAPPGSDRWGGLAAALWRAPRVRVCAGFLLLVHAAAIYAPLLANGRPYYLEATHPGEYGRALATIGRAARSLEALLPAARSSEVPAPHARAAAEAGALAEQARILAANLRGPPRGLAEALAERAGRAAAGPASDERWAEVVALARRAQVELQPAAPGADGVQLAPRRSWPLFASLSAAEVFFMALGASLLGWPLLRGRVRRRPARLALLLGLAALTAVASRVAAGPRGALASVDAKGALARGETVAERVVFPPLAFGFDETHLEEGFRPPTWTAAAKVDAAGRPVSAHAGAVLEGFEPVATPIEVRPGEPGRNHPLRHPLGTDPVGRDLLVRVLYGGRVSLSVGLVAAALLTAIGVAVGALMGYAGGRTDFALSRVVDVVLSIPPLFLILLAAALVEPGAAPPILFIVVVIALVAWTGVARLVRGEFLRLRSSGFVLAARALGLSGPRVVLRHLLPNALGPVLVAATFAVAGGMLTESVVSFLGFGIQHPVPSWGSLVSASRHAEHWWIRLFPGLLIFATVASYNLLGEALRDALDPRLRVPAP